MNSSFATNILLTVIAALLLVQVIQTSFETNSSYSSQSQMSFSGYSPHEGPRTANSSAATRNPTVKPEAPMMAHTMFGRALLGFPEGCDKQKTLAECDSPAAAAVKKEIDDWANSGLGPRQVFDAIVDKYGIDALTPQAKQIRAARTSSPQ